MPPTSALAFVPPAFPGLELVALAGNVGAGKDTVGKLYFEKLGFRSLAFADEVKADLIALGRATYEELYVTKPPHVRTLMQQYGTEEMRATHGDDYWVRRLDARLRIQAGRNGDRRFVITDARFPNEIGYAHAVGGFAYRIDAPERVAAAARRYGMTAAHQRHSSERALDAFTAFSGAIDNDLGREATVGDQVLALLERDLPQAVVRRASRFAGVRTGVFDAARELSPAEARVAFATLIQERT